MKDLEGTFEFESFKDNWEKEKAQLPETNLKKKAKNVHRVMINWQKLFPQNIVRDADMVSLFHF